MANQPKSGKSNRENGLTPIPRRIHCPATKDGGGDSDELVEIAVDNFLDALAEVALAIASRKLAQPPEREVDP